jgi:hypothetical protein
MFTTKENTCHFNPNYLFNFVLLGFIALHNAFLQKEGLVIYYKFDEGKGSLIHDMSGNRHDHDGGFIGCIDEVLIYKQALTKVEIKALMNEPKEAGLSFRHIIVDTSFGGIRAVTDIDGDKYNDIVHCN